MMLSIADTSPRVTHTSTEKRVTPKLSLRPSPSLALFCFLLIFTYFLWLMTPWCEKKNVFSRLSCLSVCLSTSAYSRWIQRAIKQNKTWASTTTVPSSLCPVGVFPDLSLMTRCHVNAAPWLLLHFQAVVCFLPARTSDAYFTVIHGQIEEKEILYGVLRFNSNHRTDFLTSTGTWYSGAISDTYRIQDNDA